MIEINTVPQALAWGDEQQRAADYWKAWAEHYKALYELERDLSNGLIDTLTQSARG